MVYEIIIHVLTGAKRIMRLPRLLFLTLVLVPAIASAQTQIHGQVFLPRTDGPTALSLHINAAANRCNALGEFMTSAAIARQINLVSDQIAMQNSLMWVETYFERKKLNRQYRDEARIDYRERQNLHLQQRHDRLYSGSGAGDVVGDLNHMLTALARDSKAYTSIFLVDKPQMRSKDYDLSAEAVSHIILEEIVKLAGATRFQLANPQLIEDIWPEVLKRDEFNVLRAKYESQRSQVINEIKTGPLTLKTFEELNHIIAELENRFDEVYNWPAIRSEIGESGTGVFLFYRDCGESFFRSQRAGALKAFARNKPGSFSTQRHFHGDTLTDLLKYCDEHNVKFAQPPSEGYATYEQLHHALREIYLEFITDAPTF